MIGHRKSTWHIVHLILTLIFFPWLLVWVCCAMMNSSYNRRQEHKELMMLLAKGKE